jgi:hypothetical protein
MMFHALSLCKIPHSEQWKEQIIINQILIIPFRRRREVIIRYIPIGRNKEKLKISINQIISDETGKRVNLPVPVHWVAHVTRFQKLSFLPSFSSLLFPVVPSFPSSVSPPPHANRQLKDSNFASIFLCQRLFRPRCEFSSDKYTSNPLLAV